MHTGRPMLLFASLCLVINGCAAQSSGQSAPTDPGATQTAISTGNVEPTGTPAATPMVLADGAALIEGIALPALLLPGDNLMWVAESTRILGIDPVTDVATVVVSGLPPGHHPTVGANGSIWSIHSESARATEYDAATGEKLTTLPLGEYPLEPLVAFGSVWVPNHHAGTLTRIDLETSSVAATITIGEPGPGGPTFIAAGGGLLWAVPGQERPVVGIDPATNEIVRTVPGCADGVGYAFDRLWLRQCNKPSIAVRDPETGDLLGTVEIDVLSWPVAFGGRVWWPLRYSATGTTTLVGVDPDTLAVSAEYVAPAEAESFAAGLGSFWLGGTDGTGIVRVPFSALPSR
jgi:hypothetical protein